MIRTGEVLQTIGLTILRIAWEKFLKTWSFFRLGTLFAGLWWMMTRPYEWFMNHSDDGEVNFSRHVSNPGAALLDLCFFPYELYRNFTGGLGESEMDKDALKIWFTIGILTVLGGISLLLYFSYIGSQPISVEN